MRKIRCWKIGKTHIMIGRGHRLVVDDIVVSNKLGPRTILASHDEKTKEFLALGSAGLLNVVRLYDRKAFQDVTRNEIDNEQTKWQKNSLNNELDHEPSYTEYLGVRILHIEIQLLPGA